MRPISFSILLTVILTVVTASSQTVEASATTESLRGLPGIAVGLDLSIDGQPGDPALTALLMKDIELKLRMGEVPILTPDQAVGLPGMPQLQISIIMKTADGGKGHVFAIFVELLQRVSLAQNPAIRNILAPTWTTVYTLGYSDASDTAGGRLQKIRNTLKEELIKFTEAYRSVNPPAQLL